MRKFFYIIIAFLAFGLCACNNGSGSSTTQSSVAQLKAFAFANNDSMPGLSAAVFTIEERLDTGWVYNKDSMLYGTKLDRVVPRFTFAATPSRAYLTFPDTVVTLTGYDTLDFTKRPIYLTIHSSDKTNMKVYEIDARAHQADPDLYVWNRLTEDIYPNDDSEQRVLQQGDDFVMMVSNGFDLSCYFSSDGADWSLPLDPVGLPAGTRVRQMISDGTTFYYAQDSTIYTSDDAVIWTANPVPDGVVTMMLYWNEKIWVLALHEGKYEFATYADGALTLTGVQPNGLFPISDFATVVFQSPSERQRAMIIGGFAENGLSLNTRWNIEYSPHIKENNGYRVEEYSIDRPQFKSLTGGSVINYDGKLMLFGGVDENMQYTGRDILISKDEGLNWVKADTAKNQLPEVYQARQKQTAIVRDNNIYLFGGQDSKVTYSDVYVGRLNSIDWDK